MAFFNIMRTLDTFNLERALKNEFALFTQANIESAALNNGFLTKWLRPSRGVHQGCLALSPHAAVHSFSRDNG